MKKTSPTQEFRQNIFSKEWVLVSTNRETRPNTILKPSLKVSDLSKLVNPFREIVEGESKEDILLSLQDDNGQTQVFVVANAYPLLQTNNLSKSKPMTEGPYQVRPAQGYHEVVIYRDEQTPVRNFSLKKMGLMFQAFQKRSLVLMKDKHIQHIAIIHNHGWQAGASIAHPHSQIIASPIIPDGIDRIVAGSQDYYTRHKRNLSQLVLEYELEVKQRIILENDCFVALCPYASASAYEVQIHPKDSQAHFSYLLPSQYPDLARIYKYVLKAYYQALGDIDYNMNIISPPVTGQEYPGMGWFIRLTPRIDFVGGYELATDTDICPVSPEQASQVLAQYL